MRSRIVFAFLAVSAATGSAYGQQGTSRRANMVGGGNANQGKCTVEIIVDGAAEVSIRGDTAILNNLKGQMPQWRRFECSGVMPANPQDFRFAGVDGRGSQALVRDPRNGGAAVIQIVDPGNGSEGYTFDIFWGNGYGNGGVSGGYQPQRGREYNGNYDRGNNDRGYSGRGNGDGYYRQTFGRDDAVRTCQDAVRREAADHFQIRDLTFRSVAADNNSGNRDVVEGYFDATRGGFGRDEAFRFSCSVNFETGLVRSAQVEPDRQGSYRNNNGRYDSQNAYVSSSERALSGCRDAVEYRLANDGYANVTIDSIRADDRSGRRDWIIGNARAQSRRGRAGFRFSCSVDLRDGDVRTVDVQPR